MKLPGVVNSERTQTFQTDTFGGVNFTDGAKENELAVCKNLSADAYPFLSPRNARRVVGEWAGADAFFMHDGHQIVCKNGILYYDGEAVTNVSSGEKQFAVINTQLVVFPDKLIIDKDNSKVTRMEVSVSSTGTVTVESDSITMESEGAEAEDVQMSLAPERGSPAFMPNMPIVYTYGTSITDISWDETNGWTLPEPVAKRVGESNAGFNYPWEGDFPVVEVGDIIIPAKADGAFSSVEGVCSTTEVISAPDTSKYNNEGFYGVVTKTGYYTVYYTTDSSGQTYKSTRYANATFDVYNITGNIGTLSEVFNVGDVVEITGMDVLCNNVEAKITAIDGNTLTFSEGSLLAPKVYATVGAQEAGTVVSAAATAGVTTSTYYFTVPVKTGEGALIYSAADMNALTDAAFYLYDPAADELLSISTVEEATGAVAIGTFARVATQTSTVTLTRKIPDLDFICSHKNRLYGLSNSVESTEYDYFAKQTITRNTRVLFVSALGMPMQFETYDGTAADSYQVAFASEGDFTAICSYGEDVLLFKEREFFKFYGDYPSAMGYYQYDAEGVAQGSYKSLAIIDEILYFLGRDGVYRYTGGIPSLLGYSLGAKGYKNGVGASTGHKYYISVQDRENAWHLFVYDTLCGLWHREDDSHALDLNSSEGIAYMLLESGLYETGNNAPKDWDIMQDYLAGVYVSHDNVIYRSAVDVAGAKSVRDEKYWKEYEAPSTYKVTVKQTGESSVRVGYVSIENEIYEKDAEVEIKPYTDIFIWVQSSYNDGVAYIEIDGERITTEGSYLKYTFTPKNNVTIELVFEEDVSSVGYVGNKCHAIVQTDTPAMPDTSSAEEWDPLRTYTTGEYTVESGIVYEAVNDVPAGTDIYDTEWVRYSDGVVDWEAEFTPYTDGTIERKTYRWIMARLEAHEGTTINFYVTAGDKTAEKIWTAESEGWYTIKIPVPPAREDRLKLKISGTGYFKLRSLVRIAQIGSEN